MSRRVAVYGAGSWGTAFSLVLADAGCEVTPWGRRAELVDAINATRINPDYLPQTTLPATVRATADPAEATRGADIAVFAVSAQSARGLLEAWSQLWEPHTVFVSLMKGIELGTGKLMSEVIAETTGARPDRIAVVSGLNLAGEIVARKPAASVVGCPDEGTAALIQAACHTPHFRPYTNTDVIGCELGGAIKNVIALAVGVTDGMGLGDNARAALVTRGLAEVTRLGVAMGADPLTLAGLAGMGDLVATCSSTLSRNHTFGAHLGRGLFAPLCHALSGRPPVNAVPSPPPLKAVVPEGRPPTASARGAADDLCEDVLRDVTGVVGRLGWTGRRSRGTRRRD
ncbi:NAD(P)H-dependent glycerol-3-phosphate dehydrogenase [Streptomyces sp. NPDC002671]